MRVRTVLLSSAAIAGLFVASYGAAPRAFAQKGMFLTPSTQWAVTQVRGDGEAAGGYCAVAQQFDQDTILTIARNEGEETSFALDFQSSQFQAGKSIGVMLDPGAGEQRSYQVIPISAQALVVKLGLDDRFFTAVERTGMLRVEVAGQSYVFDVSDIDAGEAKLSKCLSTIHDAPAVEEAAFHPSMIEPAAGEGKPGVDDEMLVRLNGRIEALESHNQGLRSELSRARNLLAQGANSAVDDEAFEFALLENARLKEKLLERRVYETGARSGGQSDLHAQIASLESENASLQDRLRDISQKRIADEDHLRQQIIALENQNAVLAEQLDFTKTVTQKNQDALILRLRGENEELRDALENTKGLDIDVLAQLRRQIDGMEQENRRLRASAETAQNSLLQQKQAEISLLKQGQNKTIATLKQTIEVLQTENRKKSRELSEVQDLAFQSQTFQSENSRLMTQVQKLEADLQMQYDAVRMANANVRELNADLAARSTELENAILVASRVGDLETELVFRDLVIDELEGGEAQYAALVAEKGALDESAQNAKDLYVKNVAQEALIAELRNEVQSLRSNKAREGFGSLASNTKPSVLLEENIRLQGMLEKALGRIAALDAEIGAFSVAFAAQKDTGADTRMGDVLTALNPVVSRRVKAAEAIVVADASLDASYGSDFVPVPSRKPRISRMQTIAQDLNSAVEAQLEDDLQEKIAAQDKIVIERRIVDVSDLSTADILAQLEPSAGLSEAQRQEKLLQQKLDDDVELVFEPIEAETEPVEVRLSEDPFEEIEVEPPQRVFEAQENDIVPEIPARVSRDVSRDIELDVLEEDVVTDTMPAADDLQPVVSDVVEADPIPMREDLPEPEPEPELEFVPEAAPAPVAAPVDFGRLGLKSVLDSADIVSSDDVLKVDNFAGDALHAYQWKSEGVYGSGEESVLRGPAEFDGAVERYLLRTERRCNGDFAVIPDNSKQWGSLRVDSYEVACVGAGVNSGASIVFYSDGKVLSIAAHEVSADHMDRAMALRDRVFDAVLDSPGS